MTAAGADDVAARLSDARVVTSAGGDRSRVRLIFGALLLGCYLRRWIRRSWRPRCRRSSGTSAASPSCPGSSRPTCSPRRSSAPLYGKLGDLYGRKLVLQSAIVDLPGGFGTVRTGPVDDRADRVPGRPGPGRRRSDGRSTMAVVGDVVPPRDRGRYQGSFGAVFGVSTRSRAAARGLLRGAPLVAMDLLRQPARSA